MQKKSEKHKKAKKAKFLQPFFGGPWKAYRNLFHLFTADIPQSEIVATNFYDRAKSWAKNWAKNWAKFWTKFSGHFRASLAVQNDPPKFLPKFLPIYHSMSWHGSCDWNLKISSPRASGVWGAQPKFSFQKKRIFKILRKPYLYSVSRKSWWWSLF